MAEDRDSERLTDVADAFGGHDDDPIGMRIGPGTEIGGYVIDGELGHGGMGVVYSATHPVIGKRAAIKILRLDVSRSPIAVERFIQEARAVNQIGHPNIIDIFAYGALPDGRAYHVMDLLVGESLRRRLKRGVLHPSEAASVIDEIASALSAAHDHGFVHRDLKPDNVFLVHHAGRWPEVKLLDFGLAKLMPEYGVAAFTTKTGVMLGTPEYMSPEQARGIGVDYRTDIYALGVVMFELLAGHRPFPALGDSLATLLQHAEEPPASLADTVAGLPDEMVQLVAAMLAKTPQARPSLAAVRTVIKRLRTTQLPTRSVAGVAMASFSPPAADAGLKITASRVGAEAVLPGDSLAGRRISQPMTTPGVGLDGFRTSNPGLPRFGPAQPALRQPPSGSQPLPPVEPGPQPSQRSRSPSGPPPPGSQHPPHPAEPDPRPSQRSRSPSGPPHGSQHPPHPVEPSPPSSHRLRSPSGPPAHGSPHLPRPVEPGRSSRGSSAPGASSAALRTGSQKLPPTILGVGPPPKLAGAPSDPSPRTRRPWLAIAALLLIACAVALAVALIGT